MRRLLISVWIFSLTICEAIELQDVYGFGGLEVGLNSTVEELTAHHPEARASHASQDRSQFGFAESEKFFFFDFVDGNLLRIVSAVSGASKESAQNRLRDAIESLSQVSEFSRRMTVGKLVDGAVYKTDVLIFLEPNATHQIGFAVEANSLEFAITAFSAEKLPVDQLFISAEELSEKTGIKIEESGDGMSFEDFSTGELVERSTPGNPIVAHDSKRMGVANEPSTVSARSPLNERTEDALAADPPLALREVPGDANSAGKYLLYVLLAAFSAFLVVCASIIIMRNRNDSR